jgi:N-acetylglucosaminyl-diphospho-decaprenol L-rhamnosyltransferase
MHVTVVVVSYNVAALLGPCLESVQRTLDALRFGSSHSGGIVVVDNASCDGSAALVRERFPNATVVENQENAGFGAACNQGLALAREAVLFLNPDTEMGEESLLRLLLRLEQTPAAALVGPRLVYPDSRPQPSRRRFPTLPALLLESTPLEWRWPHWPALRRYRLVGEPEAAGPVDWLSGACLLGRTTALRSVGGFDPLFFMYFEEVDLSRRLAARGWETWFEPAAEVTHAHSQSADQDLAGKDRMYFRSKRSYVERYFGRTTARLVALTHAAAFGAEHALQRARGDDRLAARYAALARLHAIGEPAAA